MLFEDIAKVDDAADAFDLPVLGGVVEGLEKDVKGGTVKDLGVSGGSFDRKKSSLAWTSNVCTRSHRLG